MTYESYTVLNFLLDNAVYEKICDRVPPSILSSIEVRFYLGWHPLAGLETVASDVREQIGDSPNEEIQIRRTSEGDLLQD